MDQNNFKYDDLVKKLKSLLSKNTKKRVFIGINGAPASGKSTVSLKLKIDLESPQIKPDILQMDGFHFDDEILKKKNLLIKKGSPETFDSLGLINFMKRLNNEENVAVPIFDRSLELSRSSAYIINSDINLIIVEGNYLLLKKKPWEKLRNFFDYTISIKCSLKALEKRSIDRWKSFDIDDEIINKKVFENDLPNGQFVVDNSSEPNFYLLN